jgi:hypothetical protein
LLLHLALAVVINVQRTLLHVKPKLAAIRLVATHAQQSVILQSALLVIQLHAAIQLLLTALRLSNLTQQKLPKILFR